MAPYLTARDVCARYQIGRTMLYALVKRGDLPKPLKFSRAARWSIAQLEAAEAALGGCDLQTGSR